MLLSKKVVTLVRGGSRHTVIVVILGMLKPAHLALALDLIIRKVSCCEIGHYFQMLSDL